MRSFFEVVKRHHRAGGKRRRSIARSGGMRKRSSSVSGGKKNWIPLDDSIYFDNFTRNCINQSWYGSSCSYHKLFPATKIPSSRLKKLAAKLVDFYNRRKGLEYELVEDVKGFSVVRDGRTWRHLNFRAKLKDSQPSDVDLFFGELDGEEVPTCCIVDPNIPHTFCDVCDKDKGQVILHPIFGTLSMCVPPACTQFLMLPSLARVGYEQELIKAGGNVEKATMVCREIIYKKYIVVPGCEPSDFNL